MRQLLLAVSLTAAVGLAASGCDKVRPIAGPDAAVPGCAQCHGGEGGDTTGAPPRALARAQANPQAVGAHRAHLGKNVRCEDCHVVPSRVGDPGHLTKENGAPEDAAGAFAEVPFPATSRARLGNATPAWNHASGTCSNVYCHGATSAQPPAAPTWTGAAMTCGSCHASPPASHTGNLALTDCARCHPATVTAGGAIVPGGGGHINGVVDFDPATACTACHGNGTRVETVPLNKAAPPLAVNGSPNTGAVGAHQAHLHDGVLSKAFECKECHVVPEGMDHFSTPPARATVTWSASTLATTGGIAPAWTTATGRCGNVYCHGASLSGGSNKTPLWTGGLAQVGGTGTTLVQRCGVCHGAPPASPHPDVDKAGAAFTRIGQCADCHPGTVDGAADEINVAGGLHVNGKLDLGNFHPAGFATPTVHGRAALARRGGERGLAFCQTCHGATFNGDVGPSCNACHETAGHATWLTECTFCHGNGNRVSKPAFANQVVGSQVGGKDITADQAAPPVGTQGEQTASQLAVGAHEAHLAGVGTGNVPLSKSLSCTECHGASLPTNADHANASVAIGWGDLAKKRGVVPTPADGGAFDETWENNPNCTNYCHGTTLGAGAKTNPSWVVAADGVCGACHGMRPGTWHPANSGCSDCHGAGYVSLGGTDPQKHVNGTVELTSALGCTSCHGGTNPAPPKATTGATSGLKVGAHQAHVTGTTLRAAALACSACHGTTPATLRHANGAVDMGWSTTATAGAATVTPATGALPGNWESTPTCTNYCHGNTLRGGSRTTPNWGDSGALAASCGACHGAPPAYNGAGAVHHVENPACGGCHTGFTATSMTPAARATHINGTVNVVTLTCGTCHTAPPGGATFSATTGATAASDARVGAHAAHVVAGPLAGALACADCHGALPASLLHASGDVNLAWSSVATAGGTFVPSPVAGTVQTGSAVSCANYCHGSTLTTGFGGAANKTVSWTGGAAAAACGTCHFVVASTLPVTSTHPRTDNLGAAITLAGQCSQCHGGTVNADGTINLAGGLHVNGRLDGGNPHPANWALAANHGREANTSGLTTCIACHGDPATGGAAQSCNACHATNAHPSWQTECTFCHGDPARTADATFPNVGTGVVVRMNLAAPPVAASSRTVSVGAHLAHVDGSTNVTSTALQCTQCHGPTIPTGLAHLNTVVAAGWSTLASGGGAVVPTPAGFNALWETAPTCTNYCHGATLEGGTKKTSGVSWTGGALEATCGTCHSTPLPYTAASGWHVQNNDCNKCHAGYAITPAQSVVEATHVNGATNVGSMTCNTCHTFSVTTAFSATTGATAASDARVGAHVAHAGTARTLAARLACTDCHGTTPGALLHANGVVEIGWVSYASQGGAATPAGPITTGTAVSCANYCHGATLPGGLANKTVSWTGGAAAAACGTCHFSGTPVAPHTLKAKDGITDITNNGQCVECHPNTMNATGGTVNAAGGFHVNGAVEATGHAVPYAPLQHSVAFEANQAGCQGCHGVNYDTVVDATTTPPKSCNSCHANPQAFGAPYNTGVANAAWATDCTFCHGDRTRAGDTAFALAGSGTFRLNAVAPPEALTDGVTSPTVVQVGAHLRHLQTTSAPKVQCTACHGAMPANLSHMNGVVALAWSTLVSGNGAVTPTPAAFDAAFEATPTCTNYCHGANLTGGSKTTPSWTEGATGGACGTCHFVAGAGATGTHAAHVNNAAVIGTNFACADCHSTVVNATTQLLAAAATLHVNGTDNVSMVSRGSQANGTYVAGSCAASYCHSSGQATPAFRSVAWTGAGLGCNGCHGTGTASGAPDYASGAAGSATANSHAAHTGAGGSTCQDCHSGLVNAAGNAIAGASHVNGTREVVIRAALDTNAGTSNYNTASKTCSSVSCHGNGTPQWGGAALKCSDCHAAAGAGADVDSFTFGTAGVISTTEWAATGHGQPAGALFTAATAFPTISAGQPCLYCHDTTTAHDVAANPFRLHGATIAAGVVVPGSYNAAGANHGNDVCLNCHGATGNGVAPGGQALRDGTKFIAAEHYGAKHGTSTGGRRCWDCHDPHGDGNVKMVGKKVVQTTTDASAFTVANTTRVPATGTLSFTANTARANFVNASFTGVCQVCHTTALHFSKTLNEEATHNAGTLCTTCHTHDQPPTDAFGAGAGHVSPYPQASHAAAWYASPTSCQSCHGATYATLVPTSGGSASCNTCHANPAAFNSSGVYTGTGSANWQTDCKFCHGSTTLNAADTAYVAVGSTTIRLNQAAPPEAVADGVVATTSVKVGAHQKHFTTTTAMKVQCAACHGATVPGDLVHVNGVTALGWSTIATDSGKLTPTPALFNATWEGTPTCTVYCHGANLAGGTRTTPSWTEGATGAACGTCHFVAGASSSGTHAKHLNNAAILGTNFACADCHSTVVNATTTLLAAAGTLHVNGTATVAMANRGTQSNGSYAAGSCAASYCHSSGQATPVAQAIAWTGTMTTVCAGCHGVGTTSGAPNYASGAAGSATANSHAAHTGAGGSTCQDCHSGLVNAGGTAILGSSHVNGTREVVIRAALDTNAGTSNYNTASKTCSSVSCHGNGTPQWGGAALKCSDCHAAAGTGADVDSFAFGTAGVISTTEWAASGHGQAAGALFTAATALPTIAAGQPCLYCHDAAVAHDVNTNPFRLRGASSGAGATFAAYNPGGASNGNEVCLNCHGTGSVGVNPAAQGLRTGTKKIDSWHAGAKHTTNVGGRRCWDCHDPHGDANIKMIGKKVVRTSADNYSFLATRVPASGTLSFTARGTGTDFANASGTGVCNVCHTSAAHYTATSGDGHNSGTVCTTCHAHDQATATAAFAPVGGGDCTGCHASAQGSHRAVTPEFASTWSHKRSATAAGTVTKYDCAVCHMEGDTSTGATTTKHQDGFINLRDPDTGAHIKGASFVTASGTSPGFYTSTAVDLSFTVFRRNLSSSVLEEAVKAVMINQCLKCHDANGASSCSNAAVPAGSKACVPTTGTDAKPFGTTISGAAYTGAGVTAGGTAGGVTDVNASFATTNSSYHPVRGANNNWYAKLTRMSAPWNASRTGTTANTTSWGAVISCWDCHAAAGARGLLTGTVTAHGGPATLRGAPTVTGVPSASNQASLCVMCHAGYQAGGSTHAAGSALSGSTNGTMTPYLNYGCNRCHASNYTTAVARPVRGIDVHGVNALPTNGTKTGRWSGSAGTPAQTDTRPYAFIRNTTSLSQHMPARIGGSTYTPTCTHLSDSPCSSRTETYSPGGTY